MAIRTLSLLALLVAPVAVAAQDGARWTVHERIIIRLPRITPRMDARRVASRAAGASRTAAASRAAEAPRAIEWRERKAPRCVAITDLTGAAFSGEGDIDLIVNDGRRMRAKLGDDCPALDFYSGFYLKQTADGKLCADRDAIRSRSGATCPIDRFRALVAKR